VRIVVGNGLNAPPRERLRKLDAWMDLHVWRGCRTIVCCQHLGLSRGVQACLEFQGVGVSMNSCIL
jgi:hypothetical protein